MSPLSESERWGTLSIDPLLLSPFLEGVGPVPPPAADGEALYLSLSLSLSLSLYLPITH
jgi:hypothetical protein